MHVVRGFAVRHRGVLVFTGLVALALAIYLPYALKGGWYYDDWSLYAIFKHGGSSWADQFEACTASIPGGRNLSCLYHVTEYHFLTDNRTAYHLVSIAFLLAMSAMVYAILLRCRLAWYWAALVAAMLIVFPSSDSTRLWATGAIGQYVIALELGAVLIALAALRRPWGKVSVALHLASLLLMLLAMVTYEIAVPLVALNGIIYWAAGRNRAALKRGAVDLGLAFAFLVYRLAISPPAEEQGFTVHRTVTENITRAHDLVEDAWKTWHETFLPGTLGTIIVIVVVLAGFAGAFLDPTLRRRLRWWWYLLGGAVVVAAGATFVFQTANVLYAPQTGTLFNRVVLPASIAYVCVFVALLGIGAELIARFVRPPWLAGAAVAVVVLVSAWHQLRISTDHKREFEASWSEQQTALPDYQSAVSKLPPGSRILSFGVANWEAEYIPIFAASWDLFGALRYTTSLEPVLVQPFGTQMKCGVEGVLNEEALYVPYRVAGQPLYFIDTAAGGRAVRIRSKPACDAAIERWGVPPTFAGEEPNYEVPS